MKKSTRKLGLLFPGFYGKKSTYKYDFEEYFFLSIIRFKNYRDIYSKAVRERSEQALQMSDPGQGWKPCSIQASSLAGSNPEGLPIKPEVCQNSLWNGSQVKGGALATTLWKKLRSPVRERSEQGRRRTP